jgi:hypothetical protein
MIFKTENTEKRLTQTQIKCLLKLLGGKVATVRNNTGNIIVVDKEKVGNLGTVNAMVDAGALVFSEAENGWHLTPEGISAARRFTYMADIDVSRVTGKAEYLVRINSEEFGVWLQDKDVIGKSNGEGITLFSLAESPEFEQVLSNMDVSNSLMQNRLEERIVKGIVSKMASIQ